MTVTKRLRFEILRRDNHACRYCGQMAPDVKLTVDHVVPVALGGTDEPTNLVTACAGCNGGKTSIAPDASVVANVADDAIRYKLALEAVIADRAEQRAQIAEELDWFDEKWCNWGSTDADGVRHTVPRTEDWRETVTRWIAGGLTSDELVDQIPAAMRKASIRKHDERWTYFCGIGWGMLRDLQEAARARAALTDSTDTPSGPACEMCGGHAEAHACVPCLKKWVDQRIDKDRMAQLDSLRQAAYDDQFASEGVCA